MSTKQQLPTEKPATRQSVDMKLEVVVIPVSNVDRAKDFYARMGWRVDADFAKGDAWRVVQVTPPGSACSFFFGKGLTNASPGSAPGLLLVVDDVDAARVALKAAGGDVSDVFHFAGDEFQFNDSRGRLPGRDPQDRSYFSLASFSDPDGNTWLIQEVKTRLAGRGLSMMDVADLVPLLREAEERHGRYEGPKHHWSTWYGGYVVARARGSAPDVAEAEAARAVEDAR